jgi:glycine/D-amino acid oxidase-like deaminating enzyme
MGRKLAAPPSVWAAPVATPRAPLEGFHQCDLVVVGGGLVGLTAAKVASQYGLSVMMVEADSVGSGASGANAAGVAPIWGAQTPDGLIAEVGAERAAILNQALAIAGSALVEQARAIPFDCGTVGGGYLALAAKANTAATFVNLVEQWKRAGADVTLLGKSLADHVDGPRYVEAMLFASGGTLNPRAYAEGLARLCEDQGVRIFEQSRVTGMQRQRGRWSIESASGRIEAATAVLAVHGAASSGWDLDQMGWRVDCQLIGSAPLSDAQRKALPTAPTFADLDDASVFGGTVAADGRLIATVLPGPGRPSLAEAAEIYSAKLARAFPDMTLPLWESMDCGHILLTPAKVPRLIQLGEGLYAGQGCNGFGLCAGTLLGEDLARLAIRRPEISHRFPLETPRISKLARIAPILAGLAAPVVRRFS